VGFLALIVVIVFAAVFALRGLDAAPAPSSAEIRSLIESQQVDTVTVKDDTLTLVLKKPWNGQEVVTAKLYSAEMFHDEYNELLASQQRSGILADYNYEPTSIPWWVQFVPWIVLIALFALMWYVMIARQAAMTGGSGGGLDRSSRFSHARTKTVDAEGKRVTFADVAGADEEKAELQEVVDFLKDPQRYLDLGARIPKGILLVGPPGTGKTLLAKAVAGEAGVNFLSISGSDFVELYVGVGASRVRDLFDQAKKDSPAIVFIDEIDAVGRQRGAGLGGGHDEREQTLNQLLVEMDGFGSNEGVVVLAATNRVDILDPALLRPGRFDRQVYVGYPDQRGREEILKVHARNKPLGEDVDLHDVARGTVGFTGADLENLMNESALLAARRRSRFITKSDLDEAVIKVIAGPEKRSHIPSEQDKRITAYHEAGHAIATHVLPTQDPVHQITIVPRGAAAGMTIHLPVEDRGHVSREKLCEEITVLLGGRVAEELVFGSVCTGAMSDLQRASQIARDMVTKYGMSEKLGNVTFTSGHDEVFIGRSMAQAKPYSETVATLIDEEVKTLIDQGHDRCKTILEQHRAKLDQIAAYLLEHETMDADAFQSLFDQQ